MPPPPQPWGGNRLKVQGKPVKDEKTLELERHFKQWEQHVQNMEI